LAQVAAHFRVGSIVLTESEHLETAWGDQYAYTLESLRQGREAEVYFLDALSMTAEIVSRSFVDFIGSEFLRCAIEPYDETIKGARAKLGTLAVSEHIVYAPSVLLGAPEEINNVQKMDALTAMIINGDLALQLDDGLGDRPVLWVEAYEDELRRMRLRVVWG
jgi:hypothetical protein